MKPTRSISLPQLSNQQLSELMLLRQHVTEAFVQGTDDLHGTCLNYKIASEEAKSQAHIVFAYFMLGEFNARIENYGQAIKYYLISIKKNRKSDPSLSYQLSLALALCYKKMGKHHASIKFQQRALTISSTELDWKLYHQIAISYHLLKQPENADEYLEKSTQECSWLKSSHEKLHDYIATQLEISKILMAQKNYLDAEQLLHNSLKLIHQHGVETYKVLGKYHLSKLYVEQNKFQSAHEMLMTLFDKPKKYKEVQLFLPLLLLAEVSNKIGLVTKAFQYFEQSLELARSMDEMALVNCLNKYYEFLEDQEEYEKAYIILKELQQKTEQLELTEKENELRKARTVYQNREQEIRLENLTAINELNKELEYRTNELEEKNVRLEKVRRELMEGQLLRSQMNPHFIYNSLNSISSLIKTDENEKADKYLLKFSKLTRNIFANSNKEKVLLASEISIVWDYLEMEKLRFKNRFDYVLTMDDTLAIDSIYIPPMILQPIVENAIKHGIFHLSENVMGNVKIKIASDFHPASAHPAVKIEVTDNGVGLKQKTDFLTNHLKQSALFITIKRLRNFNKTENHIQNLFYEVLEPHGTKFTLYIII